MATSSTIKAHDRFPVGTTVNVYEVPFGRGPLTGTPTGAVVTSAVVGSTGVTFTGLTEGKRYAAHALVDGQNRWVQFTPDIPKGLATTPGESATIGNATGQLGFFGAPTVARPAAIASPTAPGVAYSQAEAQSMKTAVDAIRTALANLGITA